MEYEYDNRSVSLSVFISQGKYHCIIYYHGKVINKVFFTFTNIHLFKYTVYTTVQKFVGQILFSKDTLNWSEVTVKTIQILQNISISNKWCSVELIIHQKKPENLYHGFHKNTTVFKIDNNKKCLLSSKSAY